MNLIFNVKNIQASAHSRRKILERKVKRENRIYFCFLFEPIEQGFHFKSRI